MARFEAEQLDEIRSRVDIVDFIGRTITLKPSGSNFLGLCPFHQEKTPSFNVHRERQFFHCFGCKESGDIFEFVMKHERLSFPEAVQRLALEAGVTLQVATESPEQAKQRKRENLYLEVNAAATKFFSHTLSTPEAKGAVAYLKKRGIDGRMARHFQLGFSPNRWRGLLDYLSEHGFSTQAVVAAGLAVQRDGKEPFDLFRNRVMFPITDSRGQVVGFGGRSLHGDNPKYINTPQTQLFSKREHLYGLPQARAAARQTGVLIVCEGYTDVIALAQYGIENAVASLGTAFTSEQARTLSRWAQEVVLAFDADLAGRSAADRGLDLLTEAGLQVKVAMLPDGGDPDTFIRAQGKEAFLQVLQNALSLTEYKIEEALRPDLVGTVDGMARAVQSVLPILASIESAVAREAYVQQISERIGSSPEAIFLELDHFFSRSGRRTGARHRIEISRYTTTDSKKRPDASPNRAVAPSRSVKLTAAQPGQNTVLDEKTLLWILLKQPEHIDKVYASLGERPFQVIEHNTLLMSLRNKHLGGHTSETDPPEIAAAINDLHSWEPAVVLDADTYIERLFEQKMRRRLRRLEVELTRLPERDENAYAEQVGSLLLAYKRLRQAVRRRSTQQD